MGGDKIHAGRHLWDGGDGNQSCLIISFKSDTHFVKSVLEDENIFLIGDENEHSWLIPSFHSLFQIRK